MVLKFTVWKKRKFAGEILHSLCLTKNEKYSMHHFFLFIEKILWSIGSQNMDSVISFSKKIGNDNFKYPSAAIGNGRGISIRENKIICTVSYYQRGIGPCTLHWSIQPAYRHYAAHEALLVFRHR